MTKTIINILQKFNSIFPLKINVLFYTIFSFHKIPRPTKFNDLSPFSLILLSE